jgi:hypothetical protein|tara:strand:+ start:2926 stop:3141 length:216 start_codon:yes stop_codon:yes gene_type:complete
MVPSTWEKKMRCKACNKTLGPYSIKWNRDLGDFEVCHECLTVVREIMETHEVIDRAKEFGVGYSMEAEPDG